LNTYPLFSNPITTGPYADPATAGPTRIVLNVTYAWSHQLWLSVFAMTPDALPPSVEELVVHFKKVDLGERPRYLRCKMVDGDFFGRVLEAYHVGSPIPTLGNGEVLRLFEPFHVALSGMDLFTHMAKFLAGKGENVLKGDTPPDGNINKEQLKKAAKNKKKAEKKKAKKQGTTVPPAPPPEPVPRFKVTVVGLDEFDAARDADAAGDDAFEAIIDKLPWGHPTPERCEYANAPYTPIAPNFVNLVASFVDPSQRASVEERVKVVSSAEYLAGLSAERAAEENWWTYDSTKMVYEPQATAHE
jgi:hypothetical protein